MKKETNREKLNKITSKIPSGWLEKAKKRKMTEQEIYEGNKIIADFLGHYAYLKYHSSWNLLMPVVFKIQKIKQHYDLKIDKQGVFISASIYKNIKDNILARYFDFEEQTEIIAVWLAVIEFIKWYNNL